MIFIPTEAKIIDKQQQDDDDKKSEKKVFPSSKFWVCKDRTTFGIARIRTESSASMKMFEKKLWSQYWTRANSQSNMEFVIAPAIASSIFEVKSRNSSSIRLLKCLSVKVNKNRKQKKYNDMDCYHQCY